MKTVFFSMTALLISYYFLGVHMYTYLGLVICFVLWAKMIFHAENGLSDGFGRAVLITGCDSGFGHHLAKKLDCMGFTVFAGCLCPEGPGAQSLVEEGSDRMKVLQLDVTKDEDISLAKDFVQANLPEKGNLNTSKCLNIISRFKNKNTLKIPLVLVVNFFRSLCCGK